MRVRACVCPAGLVTDQVYAITKRLLDPRRPQQAPTAEDIEEGLIKYAPALPLDPRAFLSYNQTVRPEDAGAVEKDRDWGACKRQLRTAGNGAGAVEKATGR